VYYHINFKTYNLKTGLCSVQNRALVANKLQFKAEHNKTDGYFKIMCIPMTLVTEYTQFEVDHVLH